MKKVLFATLVGILLLAGCSTSVEKVDKTTPEGKTEAKQENQVYKVGDIVKVNDVEMVISKAEYTDPEQFAKPQKGKVLTLEVSFENKGNTQAFIDSNEFNLYDKEGNQLKPYFGYNELAVSGDLNAGKKLSGKLYFDVSEAAEYELIYKPLFSLDNKEVKFNIQPK